MKKNRYDIKKYDNWSIDNNFNNCIYAIEFTDKTIITSRFIKDKSFGIRLDKVRYGRE